MPAMPTMQQSLVLLYIVDANAAPNCLLPDVALQGSVELTLMNSTPTDLCFFFLKLIQEHYLEAICQTL